MRKLYSIRRGPLFKNKLERKGSLQLVSCAYVISPFISLHTKFVLVWECPLANTRIASLLAPSLKLDRDVNTSFSSSLASCIRLEPARWF